MSNKQKSAILKTVPGRKEGYATQSYKFMFLERQPTRKKVAFLVQNAMIGAYGAGALMIAVGGAAKAGPQIDDRSRIVAAGLLALLSYQSLIVARHTAYRWWKA
jgi:hypothetical protein